MSTELVLAVSAGLIALFLLIYTGVSTGWRFPASIEDAKRHGPVVVVAFVVGGFAINMIWQLVKSSQLDQETQVHQKHRNDVVSRETKTRERIEIELTSAEQAADVADEKAEVHLVEADDHRISADSARSRADDALARANALRDARTLNKEEAS